MTSSTTTRQAEGITNTASGKITGAGAVVDVTLGFVPRYVRVFNETDVIVWEKYYTQVDANCMKQVAAGTTTADTSSAIVIKAGAPAGDSYKGFSLSAALAASGKALHWTAEG